MLQARPFGSALEPPAPRPRSRIAGLPARGGESPATSRLLVRHNGRPAGSVPGHQVGPDPRPARAAGDGTSAGWKPRAHPVHRGPIPMEGGDGKDASRLASGRASFRSGLCFGPGRERKEDHRGMT